jgi:hypothetical protein
MSFSGFADRIWRLTPRQRMLSVGFLAAAIAAATAISDSAATLVIRASLWLVAAMLIERTFETARGASADGRALIAYLPLGFAGVAMFYAKMTAMHTLRSGSLDTFFEAAVSLLGLLLVSVVIEARRVAAYDQWLRALRGWWVAFIILGILYAVAGLTPGQSRTSLVGEYAMAWAGMVGAVAALAVVMWRDPSQQPDATRQEQGIGSYQERASVRPSIRGAGSTSTQTPVRPTPASHRAAPR